MSTSPPFLSSSFVSSCSSLNWESPCWSMSSTIFLMSLKSTAIRVRNWSLGGSGKFLVRIRSGISPGRMGSDRADPGRTSPTPARFSSGKKSPDSRRKLHFRQADACPGTHESAPPRPAIIRVAVRPGAFPPALLRPASPARLPRSIPRTASSARGRHRLPRADWRGRGSPGTCFD